jgi:hypothetical protein
VGSSIRKSIIQFLVEQGANPTTGIIGAVQSGHESMINFLVDLGADPNVGMG